MEVKCFKAGLFATNSYVIFKGDKCLLIDPMLRLDKLKEVLMGKELLAVLYTHGHFDHTKRGDEIYRAFKVPLYLNARDFELVDPKLSLKTNAMHIGHQILTASISSPLIDLKEGHYTIGPFDFEVVLASGHTQGSVFIIMEDIIFCGDTIFKGSVGRTDLYGGDMRLLKDSLRYLKKLDKDYRLFPGHDEMTTLSIEKRENPYLF